MANKLPDYAHSYGLLLNEEAIPDGLALIEDVGVPGTVEVIEEAAADGKPKKVKVRGEFARCDEATANKRIYRKELWEREISALKDRLVENKVLGELDHPSDGRTSLHRVSHIVTDLRIEKGIVVGEAVILDTEAGRNLQALLKGGAKIGVSSRGYGSVKKNESQEDVVQDDYKLVTFDFVADPADGKAYPDVFIEHKGKRMDLKSLTVEALKEANPALIESLTKTQEEALAAEWAKRVEDGRTEAAESVRASLKEEFARELLAAITQTKAELAEQVRADLLADPEIAGAKLALESVKAVLTPYILPSDTAKIVAEKDTEIEALKNKAAELDLRVKDLEEQNTKLVNVAKEVGYRYFLERTLAGEPDAELIRKLVGDVKTYANSEEIKAKIEAIRADLTKQREEAAEEKRKVAEAAARAQEEARQEREKQRKLVEAAESAAKSKSAKLEEALAKALEANKELSLKLYTQQKLTNHPSASKIRNLVEHSNPETIEDVDAIFEQFRTPDHDNEHLESVRARVRKMTRGGESSRALEEETGTGPAISEELTGIPLNDFRHLAGVNRK